MPKHLHYVEPYFGGGAVLLARDPNRNWMADGEQALPAGAQGASEVVNDIYGELTNFWRVLQDERTFERFQHRISLIPFSEAEFDEAKLGDADGPLGGDTAVARAIRFFILARQSRQGLMRDFATLSRNRTRGGINEQVSAYLGVIEGLPAIHARLRNVVILKQEALDVIRRQDGEHVLFYNDPPYLQSTRSAKDAYAHEMSEDQHRELLTVLAGITGKFMLSGYPSELYSQFATQHNWVRWEKQVDNKASSSKVKQTMHECVWCNFGHTTNTAGQA